MPAPLVASSGGNVLPIQGGQGGGVAPGQAGHGGRGPSQRNPASAGGELELALQESRQQLHRSNAEIQALRQKVGTYDDTFARMRKVFVPEERPQVVPKQQYHQALDSLLEWGLARERAGESAPVTIQIGSDLYNALIEQQDINEKLLQRVKALEEKQQVMADPRHQINQHAYANMEMFVQQGIDGIYGHGDHVQVQKQYQYKAISAQIVDEIKKLQKTQPEVWNQISRDREKQRRMVSWFVEQNMPPAARRMVEKQRIMEEPQNVDSLMEAFREAKEQYANDPATLRTLLPRIRAEINAKLMEDRRRGTQGSQRISHLYQQGA